MCLNEQERSTDALFIVPVPVEGKDVAMVVRVSITTAVRTHIHCYVSLIPLTVGDAMLQYERIASLHPVPPSRKLTFMTAFSLNAGFSSSPTPSWGCAAPPSPPWAPPRAPFLVRFARVRV